METLSFELATAAAPLRHDKNPQLIQCRVRGHVFYTVVRVALRWHAQVQTSSAFSVGCVFCSVFLSSCLR